MKIYEIECFKDYTLLIHDLVSDLKRCNLKVMEVDLEKSIERVAELHFKIKFSDPNYYDKIEISS